MKNSIVLQVRDLHNSDIKSKLVQIIDALDKIFHAHSIYHSTAGTNYYILTLNDNDSFRSIETFDNFPDFLNRKVDLDYKGYSFYSMAFSSDRSFEFFSTRC